MANRSVPSLNAPKRRKQLALPIPWVVAAVASAVLSLGWLSWDTASCTAELEEAQNNLMRILELERKYKTANGAYSSMAPCHFVDGASLCVSRIGFSMVGSSHFAYRVETTEQGFIATAVGAGGRHFGSVVRLDERGTMDLSGAVCRE